MGFSDKWIGYFHKKKLSKFYKLNHEINNIITIRWSQYIIFTKNLCLMSWKLNHILEQVTYVTYYVLSLIRSCLWTAPILKCVLVWYQRGFRFVKFTLYLFQNVFWNFTKLCNRGKEDPTVNNPTRSHVQTSYRIYI